MLRLIQIYVNGQAIQLELAGQARLAGVFHPDISSDSR